jgi:hypothetical protein
MLDQAELSHFLRPNFFAGFESGQLSQIDRLRVGWTVAGEPAPVRETLHYGQLPAFKSRIYVAA